MSIVVRSNNTNTASSSKQRPSSFSRYSSYSSCFSFSSSYLNFSVFSSCSSCRIFPFLLFPYHITSMYPSFPTRLSSVYILMYPFSIFSSRPSSLTSHHSSFSLSLLSLTNSSYSKSHLPPLLQQLSSVSIVTT
jgi:hypothetical protein